MGDESLGREAEEFIVLLRQLIRRVFALDPEDPSSDLPMAQVRVCGLLYEGPRTVSALAKELAISVSAVTQVADRLAAAGLVERTADETDRRVRNLVLTPRGAEVTRRRRTRRLQSARAVLSRLTAEERQEVLAALEVLTATRAGRESVERNGRRAPARG